MLERSVYGLDLSGCFWTCWGEPVHAVHQNGDGERLGLHSRKDFSQFVRVDSQAVEGITLGEFGVRFGC